MSFYSPMLQKSKRKVFISYYHKDDQYYRNKFEEKFGHLFINKSVGDGDINTDVSTDYIKRLIQEDYLRDTSVLVVLLGKNTLCRKHVDWEISAGLSSRVGGYSGLFGLLLPSHPAYGKEEYSYDSVPARFADNAKTDYAFARHWTENEDTIKEYIELAFDKKSNLSSKIDNSRAQMNRNTCD